MTFWDALIAREECVIITFGSAEMAFFSIPGFIDEYENVAGWVKYLMFLFLVLIKEMKRPGKLKISLCDLI